MFLKKGGTMKRGKFITVELTPEDHKEFKAYCKNHRMPVATFVRQMILKLLKERGKNGKLLN